MIPVIVFDSYVITSYVIVSSDLFCFIDDFEVCPEQPTSSVHLPIVCLFKFCLSSGSVIRGKKTLLIAEGSKIFKNNLMNVQSLDQLKEVRKSLNDNDINNAISLFTVVLQNAAEHMKPVRNRVGNQICSTPCQPGWWDPLLGNLKFKKNKLLRLFCNTRRNVTLNEYLHANKMFKKMVQLKKIEYERQIKDKVICSQKDKKAFWNVIKSVASKRRSSKCEITGGD